MMNEGYHYLDLVPKGRDEKGLPHTQAWVRYRWLAAMPGGAPGSGGPKGRRNGNIMRRQHRRSEHAVSATSA
jgi:hypothetical protein